MNYDNIKLEKGMYSICNKSFTKVLEELDPSGNYKGTDLEGLDAYQRQLKRFGIRVSGPNCDTVEKFFMNSQSAVLFPEFISRAVKKGIYTQNNLPVITAAKSIIDTNIPINISKLSFPISLKAFVNTSSPLSSIPYSILSKLKVISVS